MYHVGDSLRCFLKLCEANSENSNFRENLNPGGGYRGHGFRKRGKTKSAW